jgi:hypothetical protein
VDQHWREVLLVTLADALALDLGSRPTGTPRLAGQCVVRDGDDATGEQVVLVAGVQEREPLLFVGLE